MCGRFSFHLTKEDVVELTGSFPDPYPPESYNQPPGEKICVLDAASQWASLPWGAEADIGPDRKSFVINARSETAAEKKMFRSALKRRRCAVPASGFFEWKRAAQPSTPFYFAPQEGPGILIAGIVLEVGDQAEARTVLLTREADSWMKEIHHRAPAMIRPEKLDEWLNAELPDHPLLDPFFYPGERGYLNRHPISDRVNRVKENDPSILNPVREPESFSQGELFS